MVNIERSYTAVEAAIVDRARKPKHDTVQIPDTNVTVHTDPVAAELPLTARMTGRLYGTAKAFFGSHVKLQTIERRQARSEALLKAAGQVRGLRKIVSKDDGFSLAVFPKRKIQWNRYALQDDLGPTYSAYFKDNVAISIDIPAGYETTDGRIISANKIGMGVAAGLLMAGLSAEDINKISSLEVKPKPIDETLLAEKVQAGDIHLSAEAGEVQETWSIRPERLG